MNEFVLTAGSVSGPVSGPASGPASGYAFGQSDLPGSGLLAEGSLPRRATGFTPGPGETTGAG